MLPFLITWVELMKLPGGFKDLNKGILTSQKWEVVVVVVFRQDTISYHPPDLPDLGIELALLTSNTFSFL